MLLKDPGPLSTDITFQITICIEDLISPCMTSCHARTADLQNSVTLNLSDLSNCHSCLAKLNLFCFAAQQRISDQGFIVFRRETNKKAADLGIGSTTLHCLWVMLNLAELWFNFISLMITFGWRFPEFLSARLTLKDILCLLNCKTPLSSNLYYAGEQVDTKITPQ